MTDLSQTTIERLLRRGVSEIISEEGLLDLLKQDRPLRLKMGFDPSRPDIHLGHVVGLRKLRQFQELGHQVVLIVGDWTAQIGDPSGTSVTRPMLTHKEVQDNAKTYMEQFFKVVDKDKTETVWQSEWFSKFGLANVIELTSKFSVAQFLAREDFANRYKQGKPIAVTEFLYPLLQAYDSVVTKADVEFGGTDQKFNLLVGRDLQGIMGQAPQQLLLMPIIPGTDGIKKMSKSFDNYVSLEDDSSEMFGKIMSIPDSLIVTYFDLLTDVSVSDLALIKEQLDTQSINPMVIKKQLARDIATQFHGLDKAKDAEDNFKAIIQLGKAPEDIAIAVKLIRGSAGEECGFVVQRNDQADVSIDTFSLGDLPQVQRRHYLDQAQEYAVQEGLDSNAVFLIDLAELLTQIKMLPSKSEVRRLISQNGIDLNGKKVNEHVIAVSAGTILKIGKRGFLRFTN